MALSLQTGLDDEMIMKFSLPLNIRDLALKLGELLNKPVCLRGEMYLEVFDTELLKKEHEIPDNGVTIWIDDPTEEDPNRRIPYKFGSMKILSEVLASRAQPTYRDVPEDMINDAADHSDEDVRRSVSSDGEDVLTDGFESDDPDEIELERKEVLEMFPNMKIAEHES